MDGNEEDEEQSEVCKETIFTLSNNAKENRQFICKLIKGIDNLIHKVDLSEEEDIPAKIFTDYKSQLSKISVKKLESGEKLADSLCKCIKKTIIKLLDVKKFGTVILDYLRSNGFKVDSFENGHKLSDDDLCLLDENLLQAYKEKTDDLDKNYQVIDMIQPVIRIFYIDEDDEETYSQVLPGICRYFVKEAGK